MKLECTLILQGAIVNDSIQLYKNFTACNVLVQITFVTRTQ